MTSRMTAPVSLTIDHEGGTSSIDLHRTIAWQKAIEHYGVNPHTVMLQSIPQSPFAVWMLLRGQAIARFDVIEERYASYSRFTLKVIAIRRGLSEGVASYIKFADCHTWTSKEVCESGWQHVIREPLTLETENFLRHRDMVVWSADWYVVPWNL